VIVYPAIDLAGGKAVRLWQGQRERLRVVADDPVELAQRLAAAGARFLHLVDLDAAFGAAGNDEVVRRILAAVPCPVQVGGGVRSEARFRRLKDAGAARVVVGTAMLRRPQLVERWLAEDPEGVVVAADSRGGRVVVAGWTEDTGEGVEAFAARVAALGARHLLVTAVEQDGTGRGPDLVVLRAALAGFGAGVIASGGIGEVAHLALLVPLARRGLAGVVVGSLLVDGRATVGDLHDVVGEG
jgi:phosphoribosylformimino-5-aminoimidazole carboxamide ribotide isomerase